jgi:prepilin-type N-terminal cleavage/methylation domain-containing protein
MPNKEAKGFTLVEIMIIVAIIGLLAAIAIPNLMRARLRANEAAVRTHLRAFSQANESFRSTQTPAGFATAVAALTSSNPPYLDSSWNTANLTPGKNGYLFTYRASADGAGFSLVANPLAGQGINSYCTDQSGVVVGSVNGGGGPVGTETGCTGGTPVSG